MLFRGNAGRLHLKSNETHANTLRGQNVHFLNHNAGCTCGYHPNLEGLKCRTISVGTTNFYRWVGLGFNNLSGFSFTTNQPPTNRVPRCTPYRVKKAVARRQPGKLAVENESVKQGIISALLQYLIYGSRRRI
jgi:hypothetical protein